MTRVALAARLVVISDLGLAAGGATSLALASAIEARGAGLRVTYLTSEGRTDPALAAAGVEVIHMPGAPISEGRRRDGLFKGLWRRESADILSRLIAKADTPGTIYHLHNWGHFLSPSIFPVLKPIEDRLALTAHDFFLVCPNGAQYDFRKDAICSLKGGGSACATTNCDRRSGFDKVWRLARHGLRSAVFDLRTSRAQVIAIHPGHVPALLRSGIREDRIVAIRNPVRPYVAGRRVQAEHNREVLFVGRLTYEKGPDLAAAAAAAVGASIRFVGDGPMRESLQQNFPNAIFDGFLSRDQIGERARRARVAVMPGRWAEPYGMVAPEALWSGIPTIVSQNAYLAPEIEAAGAGYALDTRNVAEFGAALARLLGDDELTKAMSKKAHTNTRHIGLTVEDWAQTHRDLYGAMIARASAELRR